MEDGEIDDMINEAKPTPDGMIDYNDFVRTMTYK